MKTVPLRRIATVVNGGTPAADSLNWGGEVAWATPVDLGRHDGRTIGATERTLTDRGLETGSSMVPEGSIILSTRAPIGYVCVNRVAMAFNQGCRGVIPRTDVSTDYLRYALLHLRPRLQAAGTGSTFMELSTGALASMPVPVVGDRGQQGVVVDFLDRETAKIDALIAKQEALKRSVLEHRDAVILDLITGGKGAAKSEASGVDWIGDMPEHWQTRPLRHVLASVETGVWGSDPAVEWEGTPCARVADFDRERLQVTDPIPTLREVSVEDVRRRGLRRGDLLIERSGGTQANPVGFVVSFESDTEAVCSNFISRLRLQDGMNHRYWLYAFYAARLTRITEKWTKQTTGIQNLDFGGFSSENFPCPPSSEQDEIAAEIDQLMSSTGAQLQRQRLLGQLLRERRAALITAAVTGRLDVTTYGKAG